MKFTVSTLTSITAGLLLATLAGCGGGGSTTTTSSVPTPPSPPAATTFPVQQAFTSLYTSGFEKTVTANGTYSTGPATFNYTTPFQISITPAVAVTSFDGQAALQSTYSISGTLSVNNQTISIPIVEQQYLTTSYGPLGSTVPSSYCAAQQAGQYPASVTLGQTGTLASMACYTDSTKTKPAGTYSISYATSAGTSASNITFTVSALFVDGSNIAISTGATSYLIGTSGSISFVSLSISEPNFTLSGQ